MGKATTKATAPCKMKPARHFRQGRMVFVIDIFTVLNLSIGMVELGPKHRESVSFLIAKLFCNEEVFESSAEQRCSVGKSSCIEFLLKKLLGFRIQVNEHRRSKYYRS